MLMGWRRWNWQWAGNCESRLEWKRMKPPPWLHGDDGSWYRFQKMGIDCNIVTVTVEPMNFVGLLWSVVFSIITCRFCPLWFTLCLQLLQVPTSLHTTWCSNSTDSTSKLWRGHALNPNQPSTRWSRVTSGELGAALATWPRQKRCIVMWRNWRRWVEENQFLHVQMHT